MNHKMAIETLMQIEDAVDVTGLFYKDLNVWPLIRLELWNNLLHQRTAPQTTIDLSELAESTAASFFSTHSYLSYLKYRENHKRTLQELRGMAPPEALFFSRAEDHADQFQGKYYNRHLDPMLETVSRQGKVLKIEMGTEAMADTLPRFHASRFIDSIPYLRYDAKRSIIRAFRDPVRMPAVEGFDALQQAVEQCAPGCLFSEEEVMIRAECILHFRDYFLGILRAVNPISVFQVCYYYDLAMALNAAGKRAGIPVVDIQHGKQGRFHGMYTHWQHMPEKGYALLPHFFWCWGMRSAENIAKWFPPVGGAPQTVIGGNRWLARWKSGLVMDLGVQPGKPSPDAAKTILFSLQPLEQPIPEFVLEAMKQAPDHWQWLVRLHPLQKKRSTEIKQLLDLHSINAEVDEATEKPLYQLLQSATNHITLWSTVAYEASQFEIPTLLLHPTAAVLYEEEINRQEFYFVQTAEALIEALDFPYVQSATPFIETNSAFAAVAVQKIWDTSSRSAEQKKSLIPA